MLKYTLLVIASLALTTTPVLATGNIDSLNLFIKSTFDFIPELMHWFFILLGAFSFYMLLDIVKDLLSDHSSFGNKGRFSVTRLTGMSVAFLLFERFVIKMYHAPSWELAFIFNVTVFCVLALISILAGLYSLISNN
jgi:hypothetical protein